MVVPGPDVAAFWSGKEDEPSLGKGFSSFAVDNELQESGSQSSGPGTTAQQPQGNISSPAATSPAQPISSSSPRRGGRANFSESKVKPSSEIPASPQKTSAEITTPSAGGPQLPVFPVIPVVPPVSSAVTPTLSPPANIPSQSQEKALAPLPLSTGSVALPVTGVTSQIVAPSALPVSAPIVPSQKAVESQAKIVPTATVSTTPGAVGIKPATTGPSVSRKVLSSSGSPPLEEDIKGRTKINLSLSSPKSVNVKEEFSVELIVSGADNMHNGVIFFEYDPVLVDFVRATEGTFLKKDGKPTEFNTKIKKEKATFSLNIFRVGDVGGVSGGGSLATVTLMAKTKGLLDLGVYAAYILGPGSNVPMVANLPRAIIEI